MGYHDLVYTHIYEVERSAEPGGWDAECVLELGHHTVDGSSGGVAADQRLRQVGHHKAKVDQTQQDLHTHTYTHLIYAWSKRLDCVVAVEIATE